MPARSPFRAPLRALSLACLLALPSAVRAEGNGIEVTTKVFNYQVGYRMPEGFSPAFENSNGQRYIHEAVPEGETVEKWSEMITLTGEPGTATDAERNPMWLANVFADGYRRNCPETFAAAPVEETTVSGHQAFAAWFGCGRVNSAAEPMSEAAVILFVKAGEDFYTLQWAQRGMAFDGPHEMDKEVWMSRYRQLFPVSICPGKGGEGC